MPRLERRRHEPHTDGFQRTDGVDYGFEYGYHKGWGLKQVQYPSDRWVRYTPDAADRVAQVERLTSGETLDKTYWTGVQYAPQGALKQVTLGNGLIERWQYNLTRQQPYDVRLGTAVNEMSHLTLQFAYCANNYAGGSCATNNGNILAQFNYANYHIEHYGYDALNRLSSATDYAAAPNGWSQSYGFDRFGNRWVSANGALPMDPRTPTSSSYINPANNRLTGANYGYDAAGNQTAYGGWTLSYDAENRLVSSQSSGGSPTTYAYDGEGRRVKKTTDGVSTVYVYGAGGELAAEYGGPAQTTGTRYITTDHLGSTRLVTDASGNVVSRHDYLPFGEEIPAGVGGRTTGMGYVANPAVMQKFTGKEWDTETGLDYFGARYLSGVQGRWTSPDVINLTNARLLNPSSTLNKYAYAANNPLKYVDPDGLDITLYYRAPSGASMDFGHVFLGALNQQSGEVAFLDYYPRNGTDGFGSGAGAFNLGNFQERAGQNYASLTIQTTPEQAQNVINFIKRLENGAGPDYSALSHNCTTVCQDALADLGLDFGDLTPTGFWNDLFQRYSARALARKRLGIVGAVQNFFQPIRPEYRPGTEVGVPRVFGPGNFDLFRLYLNQLSRPQPKACVEVVDSATGTRSKQCE